MRLFIIALCFVIAGCGVSSDKNNSAKNTWNPEIEKQLNEYFKKLDEEDLNRNKVEIIRKIYKTLSNEYIEHYIDQFFTDSDENSLRYKRAKMLCKIQEELESNVNKGEPKEIFEKYLQIFDLRKLTGVDCKRAPESHFIYDDFIDFCTKQYSENISIKQLLEYAGKVQTEVDINSDGKKEVILGGYSPKIIGEYNEKLSAVDLGGVPSEHIVMKVYKNDNSVLLLNCGGQGEGGCWLLLVGYVNGRLITLYSSDNKDGVGLADAYYKVIGDKAREYLIIVDKVDYKGPRFVTVNEFKSNNFIDVTLDHSDFVINEFKKMLDNYESSGLNRVEIEAYEKYFNNKGSDYSEFWQKKLKPLVIESKTLRD